MARCQGTTKSGSRCKRNVAEGAEYCSAHEPEQTARTRSSSEAGASGPDPSSQKASQKGGSGAKTGERHISSGEDLLHLAIGVAVTVAMFWLLKRGPRFPGF